MNVTNKSDYDIFKKEIIITNNCTNSENNNDTFLSTLLLTKPCGLSFLCFMNLMVYTLFKLFVRKLMMEKFFNQTHPLRCIICGPSSSGKSVFLTKLILNNINEFEKIYIYSPSLHQDLYQNSNKSFSIYIPLHNIPKISTEEDIDIVIDEIVNYKEFEKSDTETETQESVDELEEQEFEDGGIIILDDLNEEEMNDPRVQAMFKRSRHINLFIFVISQELPERTIAANGNIYHIFKPNNFTDVKNLYQDEASMDMTPNQFKYLTSTFWNEKINHSLLI